MIKIIKPAPERYFIVCPDCGCEFEYELCDLCGLYLTKSVRCPSCGSDCYHDMSILRNASGHTMEELKLFLKDELAECQNRLDAIREYAEEHGVASDYNYGLVHGSLSEIEAIAMEFGVEEIL